MQEKHRTRIKLFRLCCGPLSHCPISGGPIPFPYMLTFLTVALEEGKSVGTYARELNVNRFLMSRHIRCIGDRARNGQAGLGLVTTRRVDNYPNRTAIFLTDKGRAIAAQVYRNLRRTPE